MVTLKSQVLNGTELRQGAESSLLGKLAQRSQLGTWDPARTRDPAWGTGLSPGRSLPGIPPQLGMLVPVPGLVRA